MKKKLFLIICAGLLTAGSTQAYKIIGLPDRVQSPNNTYKINSGNCVAGSSQTDLYINDVRARMLDDGDMWWDLNIAHYIVPQVSAGQTPVCSIFAGSIWVGGIDPGGQLKIAAATYRQNGNDYFPGPLNAQGTVTASICSAFDNHWQVFGGEIDTFISTNGNTMFTDIKMWPGQGNPNNPVVNAAGSGISLAPFNDGNGDGIYDPQPQPSATLLDYPILPIDTEKGCTNPTWADQMIWWVYNDEGNIHTETGGQPIGLEVKAMAFAYKTNDEVNDMTFYNYTIINTGQSPLDSTFIGQWVDPDLGCYEDDFVGCDTTRGLGMDYNGEAVDGPCTPNYGDQPPIVGTVFFQGPKREGTKTEKSKILKMTSFLYYSNDFTATGNPQNASQYYGYLTGTWKDQTPFTFGGNGHGGTTPFKFMFPGDPSDPTQWSECSAHDIFGDRRYLQPSGPIILQPGAVNNIIVGAVWVRPPLGSYPCPTFALEQRASDKAQALFNSCFKILNGPNAPDVTITELNQELVLNLVNTNNSNVELYKQVDPNASIVLAPDSFYRFEGYQIYQLLNNQVSSQNYTDITQAKLIAQCDVKDGIGTIINDIYSAQLNQNVPTLMVQGADKGIQHTFDITTDAFAQGNSQLINFQPYYFSVVSYAYNYYNVRDSFVNDDSGKITKTYTTYTQLLPYLEGRQNISIYTGIPHLSGPEAHGTTTNSFYGEGPEITRQEGQGNGGNFLDLTQASVLAILNSSNGFFNHPTYQEGNGPINVKVIDPKRVPADSFTVSLVDTGLSKYNNTDSGLFINTINLDSSTSKWVLRDVTTSAIDSSDTTLAIGNEQLFPQWGISIYINQVLGPGYNTHENNGFISSEVDYADAKNQWLSGLQNQAPPSTLHWILSGNYDPASKTGPPSDPNHDDTMIDNNQNYNNIIGGTWAPYVLCSHYITYTPVWMDHLRPPTYLSTNSPYSSYPKHTPNKLSYLNSVDVVLTSDQTKWSRCVVVEEQFYSTLSQGNALKMSLRRHADWDGGIDGNGNPVYSTDGQIGMSYFPGYAINVETGQRLNIFFGEDSWLVGQNGADMLWNPTANEFSPTYDTLLGGQHYIYVDSTQYDGCHAIDSILLLDNSSSNYKYKEAVYKNVEWVGMTFLAPGSQLLPLSQGLIPNTATIKIRVAKPYALFPYLSDSTPVYSFSLKGLAADTANVTAAKNALDYINVVPNPYYAYSNYEQSSLDNEIKFTNLPQVCTISIYTLDGQLVNTINYTGPYEEGYLNNLESTNWNLTNTAGVPVASGVYLIYFSSPNLGTRCIKWFGVRRPIDVSNF